MNNGTNEQVIPTKNLHPNERLKRERELRGWSQGEIAEKIGTDQKVVSRWECGISRPSPYFRKKLCDLYGKNTEELGLIEQQQEFSYPQEAVDEQKHPDEALISSPNKSEPAPSPLHSSLAVNGISTNDETITKLLQPLTKDPECAFIIPWYRGEKVSNIELKYDDLSSASQYASTMPDRVRQAIDNWCRKRENQEKCNKLKGESEGVQVRLEKVEWTHHTIENNVVIRKLKYFISLSPTRYLYYVAIHPRLGKAQLRSLRSDYFANALKGFKSGETLRLPSHFALHMVVVSRDGYLLLRKRADFTELYPSAWEAGIGEFMHGPDGMAGPEYESGPYHSQFRHFTEDGIPDLFLFLKNAVAEELGYHKAKQKDFRIYGFAVEYETLAPKLLVVYNADCTIATLIDSAEEAKDPARKIKSIELTPRAIASACPNSDYPSWGPTSKLVMLLALKQGLLAKGRKDHSTEIDEIEKLIEDFVPGDRLIDIWESHE
jgi:transcriptional regulator with XRE-family HTH domain